VPALRVKQSKYPGVGGGARTSGEEPLPGQRIGLFNSAGTQVGLTGVTDEDGWYFILYKHTGKPANYTVRWFDGNQTKIVTLKGNGIAEANFP